jgi:hypothetical protein
MELPSAPRLAEKEGQKKGGFSEKTSFCPPFSASLVWQTVHAQNLDGHPNWRSMLTSFSDVTHNPAAHESEASVICCLRLVRRKAVPKHAMPTQYFLASVKLGVIAFRLSA